MARILVSGRSRFRASRLGPAYVVLISDAIQSETLCNPTATCIALRVFVDGFNLVQQCTTGYPGRMFPVEKGKNNNTCLRDDRIFLTFFTLFQENVPFF